MVPRPGAEATSIETLNTLLATARELAHNLADDPQLDRLVRAFRLLPAADREPILQIVEKDAFWRRMVEATESTTGIGVRVNPHASLYVHVLEPARDVVQRDTDVIGRGIGIFMQFVPMLFQETVHAQWTAAARALAAAADATTRALVDRLVREVQAILADTAR